MKHFELVKSATVDLLIFLFDQTDAACGQNPHGLADGWAWLARLLNHIPANRHSASALEAVLKVRTLQAHQWISLLPHLPFLQLQVDITNSGICMGKSSERCADGFADGRVPTSSSI